MIEAIGYHTSLENETCSNYKLRNRGFGLIKYSMHTEGCLPTLSNPVSHRATYIINKADGVCKYQGHLLYQEVY